MFSLIFIIHRFFLVIYSIAAIILINIQLKWDRLLKCKRLKERAIYEVISKIGVVY